MSVRGKWQKVTIAEREIPAMPCLHPAYLLRTPNHKALAWNDLLAVKARLAELASS
jgi:DNA polymerase